MVVGPARRLWTGLRPALLSSPLAVARAWTGERARPQLRARIDAARPAPARRHRRPVARSAAVRTAGQAVACRHAVLRDVHAYPNRVLLQATARGTLPWARFSRRQLLARGIAPGPAL